MGGRFGAQAGRGATTGGGELVRHWPPESVAKAGLAGCDGAVIGASESLDWRLGQVSSRGGRDCQPPKAGTAGVVHMTGKTRHGPV